MQSEQKNFNSLCETHDKQDSHTRKSQLIKEDKANQKIPTKKQIRKEKNRLAAQKSRDKKQINFQYLQKQNKILKQIINSCTVCSQKRRGHTQIQDSETQKYCHSNTIQGINNNQENMIQIQFQDKTIKQDKIIEKSYLRFQDDSSQNLSKFLTFCLVAALLCLAQMSRQKYMQNTTRLLQLEILNPQGQKNLTEMRINVQKKDQKSLTGIKVKQCRKCMQCFWNITNTTSSSLMSIVGNDTLSNQTQNITNSLNKIILCKSKAAFFSRIYKAIENSGKNTSSQIRNVGKIQINGKQIMELVDKDCLTDIQFNQKKMYTVEFTLAIIQLVEMEEQKKIKFHNISIEE